MTLGYKKYFPGGEPTHFKEKVLLSHEHPLGEKVDVQIDNYDHIWHTNLYPKGHSICYDVHERWRPGLDIHHVYGNLTKERNCFLVNKCVWVQRISIFEIPVVDEEEQKVDRDQPPMKVIMVNGRFMPWQKCLEIAINDGFDSLEHFFSFFNQDFSGKIIIWDKKLRY